MRPATRLLAALLALGAPSLAAAQTSGFQPGDLVLMSPYVTGPNSDSGALVRIDPATGSASVVLGLTFTPQLYGCVAFDPWRDRLVFCASLGPPGSNFRLYTTDAAGNTTDLGQDGRFMTAITPAAGGRVYMHDASSPAVGTPIQYLDANNVLRTVLDASGTQPYAPPGLHLVTAMAFDPGTNSLLLAIFNGSPAACAGGNTAALTVRRLTLSADGSRVVADACAELAPDPLGGNLPIKFSPIPDGDFLLVVDTNSNASQPRFLRVDPVSLAISPFASNGPYLFAAYTDAGCYSSVLGKAVLIDNAYGTVRTYADGESGAGTLLTTSMPLIQPGFAGLQATLTEVPTAGCASSVGFYCTAKVTSGGCVPTLSTSGSPSASLASGFLVEAAQVEPGKNGILFYGKSGAAAAPFQGGFLCVQSPVIRTGPQFSGGAGACGGGFAFDFNAHTAAGSDPGLVAGAVVWAQFWFRDPPHPVAGSGLSGGVTFTLCP